MISLFDIFTIFIGLVILSLAVGNLLVDVILNTEFTASGDIDTIEEENEDDNKRG